MAFTVEDYDDPLMVDAEKRVRGLNEKLQRTFQLIVKGRPEQAESEERRQIYHDREKKLQAAAEVAVAASTSFERVIGNRDILSIEYLEEGLLAAQAIGRIKSFGTENGTGFLVGKNILMTNNHVLKNFQEAKNSEVDLDFEEHKIGSARNIESRYLDPERFFLTNEHCDFTLVAVQEDDTGGRPLNSFGFHPILLAQGKIRKGDPVTIVHHPQGKAKSITLHNSHLLHLENGTEVDRYCWYSTDTEKGSSGAPVFNNRWEVVALHHKAVPKTNSRREVVDRNGRAMSKMRVKANPEEVAWIANEGIRASRLVAAIAKSTLDDPGQRRLRDELLALWQTPHVQKKARKQVKF